MLECDDHQEILAGVGDPSARAETWTDLEVQEISESSRRAEKPGEFSVGPWCSSAAAPATSA